MPTPPTDTRSDAQMSEELATLLGRVAPDEVVFVTGAGISAESGIPTFRGPEGYWTVGAREYHPQEMATQVAFKQMPREVWRWYLYRKGVCNAAKPNPAHLALAALERAIGERFTLVTQNVDGLHLVAGNSLDRTLQVHGNTDFMRPTSGDTTPIRIPATVAKLGRDDALDDATWDLLVAADGRRCRPHVLWFDEYYDERLYRAETAMRAAKRCELLVVIGTSGAAALPYHVAHEALRNGAAMIDINPDPNPFAEITEELTRKGKPALWLRGTGTRWVPELAALIQGGSTAATQ